MRGLVKIGNVRDLGGSLDSHILTSAHAVDVTDNSTFGPILDPETDGFAVIGNVADIDEGLYDELDELEETPIGVREVDRDSTPGVDWAEYLGYRDPQYGLDGYVTMPAAMLHQRPKYGSNVMKRRMRGAVMPFLSSPHGGGNVTGALFIDTDGFRVQDGDDF